MARSASTSSLPSMIHQVDQFDGFPTAPGEWRACSGESRITGAKKRDQKAWRSSVAWVCRMSPKGGSWHWLRDGIDLVLVEIWCYVAWLFIVYVVVVDIFVGSAFYCAAHVALMHRLLCAAHCFFRKTCSMYAQAHWCVFSGSKHVGVSGRLSKLVVMTWCRGRHHIW